MIYEVLRVGGVDYLVAVALHVKLKLGYSTIYNKHSLIGGHSAIWVYEVGGISKLDCLVGIGLEIILKSSKASVWDEYASACCDCSIHIYPVDFVSWLVDAILLIEDVSL